MNPTETEARGECHVLWCAVAGFSLLLGAWTVLFIIAAHHRVAEVPLATAPVER